LEARRAGRPFLLGAEGWVLSTPLFLCNTWIHGYLLPVGISASNTVPHSFLFAVLGFELHHQPLHQPFIVMGFFKIGCLTLFSLAGFEH
jgi:hypothetical protein